MNHPHDEQWMSYLYDELTPEESAPLREHLEGCAACQAKVKNWQATRAALDEWQANTRRLSRARPTWSAPLVRWAAAAAIILCAGVEIGRQTSVAASEARVRAALEPQLRQEINQAVNQRATETLQASIDQTRSLLAGYAATAETNRATDNATILAAINRLTAERIADYLSLKKDVDTVAINTDLGFRSTQRELNQLADYPLPSNNNNTPPKN